MEINDDSIVIWPRLSQITEIHVGDDLFVLLTTEKDDHYVRLSEGTP